MVEHNLAKVGVASSNLVSRSSQDARMVELVDTLDLKSNDHKRSCGFKSRSGYKSLLKMKIFKRLFFQEFISFVLTFSFFLGVSANLLWAILTRVTEPLLFFSTRFFGNRQVILGGYPVRCCAGHIFSELKIFF